MITRRSGVGGLFAGLLPFLVAEALAGAIKVRKVCYGLWRTVIVNVDVCLSICVCAVSWLRLNYY